MQKNQIIEIKMMVKKDKINKAHIKKYGLYFFAKKLKNFAKSIAFYNLIV